MKLIPTRLHAVMDFLMVGALLALPRVLNWDSRVTTLFTIVAIGMLALGLLTRYEAGLLRLLPMRMHLALDFLTGLLLIAAPFFILQGLSDNARTWLLVLGGLEIGAALLTHSHSTVEDTDHSGHLHGTPYGA
jgi:hypothetical protein